MVSRPKKKINLSAIALGIGLSGLVVLAAVEETRFSRAVVERDARLKARLEIFSRDNYVESATLKGYLQNTFGISNDRVPFYLRKQNE
jgi:hypothetical protein